MKSVAEADDLSNRKFLERVMEGFNDQYVVLSYTESKIINGLGLTVMPNFRRSRDREGTGHYSHDYIKDGKREIEEIMAIRCTIPNVSAVVFRKDSVPYLQYGISTGYLTACPWPRISLRQHPCWSHRRRARIRSQSGSR